MIDSVKYLNQTKEIEKRALKLIENDVNYIIKTNCTDISIIEQTLDILMGFIYVDTSHVFDKLNNYYSKINKEYAYEYKLIYKELKDID